MTYLNFLIPVPSTRLTVGEKPSRRNRIEGEKADRLLDSASFPPDSTENLGSVSALASEAQERRPCAHVEYSMAPELAKQSVTRSSCCMFTVSSERVSLMYLEDKWSDSNIS